MNAAKQRPRTTSEMPRPSKSECILVQHQEETIREITFSMLAAAGYECRGAASPAEAWDALCSGTDFDLLLCNAAVSLEERLIERVVERFPNIPVITWGIRPISVFLETIRKGAYDYLPLPFEREQLLIVVRRALECRRLKLENREYKARLDNVAKRKSTVSLARPPRHSFQS